MANSSTTIVFQCPHCTDLGKMNLQRAKAHENEYHSIRTASSCWVDEPHSHHYATPDRGRAGAGKPNAIHNRVLDTYVIDSKFYRENTSAPRTRVWCIVDRY